MIGQQDLESLLVDYFSVEQMIDDGHQDNRYDCSNCNTKRNATKQFKLNLAPAILVISLKRFWWNYTGGLGNGGTRNKIFNEVNAPLMLDTVRLKISNAYYILTAVALHSGTAYSGHYYSMTRSVSDAMNAYKIKKYAAGTWIQQSDQIIRSNLSIKQIQNNITGKQRTTPYQYYYRRCDTINQAPQIAIPYMPIIPDEPLENEIDINMNADISCEISINDGGDQTLNYHYQ